MVSKLTLLGVGIVLVVVVVIIVFTMFSTPQSRLLRYLSGKKQQSLSDIMKFVMQNSSNSSQLGQYFVNYTGSLAVSTQYSVMSLVFNLPFNLGVAENGKASRTELAMSFDPSGQNPSHSPNINFIIIRNNTKSFVCSNLFGSSSDILSSVMGLDTGETLNSTTNTSLSTVECIDNKTLALYENISSSGLNLSMSNLSNTVILKYINITFDSVSQKVYKGSPCTSVIGNVIGNMPFNALTTGEYTNHTLSIRGNYSTCLSNLFNNAPLNMSFDVVATSESYGINTSFTINFNAAATQFGSSVSNSTITALPGAIMNLSSLFGGSCYLYHYNPLEEGGYPYSGHCTNLVINSTGALRVDAAFNTSDSGIRILGLACKNSSTFFNYNSDSPPASAFTPVNISLSKGNSQLPLVFSCSVESASLGTPLEDRKAHV